jgi:hypothetical protein
MEEVCGRENCEQALSRVKANKAGAGVERMTVRELPELSETALASDPGTVVEWNPCAATGETGRCWTDSSSRLSCRFCNADGTGHSLIRNSDHQHRMIPVPAAISHRQVRNKWKRTIRPLETP